MAAFFIFSWFVLLFYAVRLISQGWSAASQMDGRKIIKEEKRYVTRSIHPEMEEVEVGDELLVVRFDEEEPKDPLLKSLQNRIDEIEDPWDNEDDDGGLIVRK